MDDDGPYDDDTSISNKKWLKIETENDLLLEQQFCGRDNKDKQNDKDTAICDSGTAFAADCDDEITMVIETTTIMRNKVNKYKYNQRR